MVKRAKQQVLITSKGSYIEHWEKARLQKVFQNIIDKDLKIKSWGKSNTHGLKINSEKSCVMIFNVSEQPEHICNIKVVQEMKYIGIEIDNKINYFKTQREKL